MVFFSSRLLLFQALIVFLLQLTCSTEAETTRTTEIPVRKAEEWLLGQRGEDWGWKSQTHRVIMALSLTDDRVLSRGDLKSQLSIKQLHLQLALALANDQEDFSAGQLALYIDALLAVCHDPRDFYGKDLVLTLQNRADIAAGGSYAYALCVLTLCNAGVDLRNSTHLQKLTTIVNSTTETSFKDPEAMALMALQCAKEHYQLPEDSVQAITRALDIFRRVQNPQTGGFGNIYTSGLVIQALTEASEETHWDRIAALKYIVDQQRDDGSLGADLLSTFFALPPLTGRTLVSISRQPCNATSFA